LPGLQYAYPLELHNHYGDFHEDKTTDINPDIYSDILPVLLSD